MEDHLISYTTARLALKKGCDIKCKTFYGRGFTDTEFSIYDCELKIFGGDFSCYAPTQSLLQQWLREIHGIHIVLEPKKNYPEYTVAHDQYYYSIYFKNEMIDDDGVRSYNEALEIALQTALKLL